MKNNELKIFLHNMENFYVFMDKYNNENLTEISEEIWQSFGSSLYGNKPLEKILNLAATIKHHDPDLIMLTEVGGEESLENFNRYFLNSSYHVATLPSNSNRGIDLGYLIKKTLPLSSKISSYKDTPLMFLYPHELKRKKLTAANSHRFSRDVLRLDLKQNDNIQVIFLLVHLKSKLDHEKNDPDGRMRRRAELNTLIELYLKIKKQHPTVPIIIGGDFNGNASIQGTEREFAAIYQKTGLRDICELMGSTHRTTFQYFDDKGQELAMQLDYLFIEAGEDLNYQFTEGGVLNFMDYRGTHLPTATNLVQKQQNPSDHYPVFAKLILKRK
ncbi:MAG: endonuclease/exonuclease/phosphatase family protein [Bacteriovoracaceae bacterium]|nr:endonuclease/exonuclease/phosphatase family protein [Bacteriovoracaceae bacterium]